MITDLKNQFMQTAFVTTLWIFGIVTLFAKESSVDVAYVWRVLGAGTIAGLVFGVVYPYVWNYATWPAAANITVTTLTNVLAGFTAVYLCSPAMFRWILPYWWVVALLTLLGHVAAFYFYRSRQNKKLAQELNQLSK